MLASATLLGGCDVLGIESGSAAAERKEAEGKAIGSACRHALRAIEDCYTLNRKVPKAAIYTGWREMDEYMRENKLEGIVPVVPRETPKPPPAPASAPAADAADAHGAEADSAHADKAEADAEETPRKGKSKAKAAAADDEAPPVKRQATTH
ncbi:hypothetical protein [Sphaerotilus hippei]|uniref:hypothetical protein n=1 Tax=Sphaerotilus hippei TaxID=744406 RepID=UPI001B87D2D8|nr:hypothetical protein [Sphaerotilus hippei]